MTYDGQDRIATRTSGAGETTTYTYASSNLTHIYHPRGGGVTVMAYDGLNRLDLLTDPNGVQTDLIYYTTGNDAGKDRPWKVVAANGTSDASTTTFTYKPSGPAIGRVESIIDGDGLLTSNTYDGNGHPDITTAPGGFDTDHSYDWRGNLTAVADPNNRTTTFDYNKRRQPTNSVADTGGIAATTSAIYDNQARTAAVTAPAHNGPQRAQASTTYSPTDKLRLEKLNAVTVAETTYDSRDWAATAKDASNRVTTFIRKANGDLREAQRPASRTSIFAYDGDHRLTQTTNPGANTGPRVETFAYGTSASDLPRTLTTEADNINVTREFDAKGQLRFVTDRRANVFEFRYDALGRRTKGIVPGGATTTAAFTRNGRISTHTEPSGDTATFTYHGTTGRLQNVSYTGGATVNYTSYDNNGNVLSLNENGTNTITRTYDGLNRVTSYTEAGNTIGYRYYPNGKLAKLIYPGGSESGAGHVEYLYNADGRLWQVRDKLDSTSSPRVTTYSWNNDGRLQSISRPNNTTRTIGYDNAGRPEAISETAGATALLSIGLQYYPSDEIKTLDLKPAPPLRKTKAVPAVSMTFNAANRLLTFGGQSVGHDGDGNMTNGPMPATGAMEAFAYDSRNRLQSVGGLTYTYNAEGNRVGIGGSESTSLVVDANSALPKVLVRTKNGVTTRYVYGVGLQYEVNATGQATYYHYDQTGNTAMLTDQSAAVVDRITYSPYGTIRYRMAGHDTPFLYGGFFGVMTDSNGLVNMRARYYNPLTKRFLTSDPAMDGLNWYAYADGNPINFNDPTGLGASAAVAALSRGGSTSLGFAPLGNPLIGNNNITSFAGGAQSPHNGHSESEAVAAAFQTGYIGTQLVVSMAIGGGASTTAFRGTTAARVESAVANLARGEVVVAPESVATLYHGGVRRGGAVQASRLSTTTELEHALKYAAQKEGGQVYRFQVPTSQLNQWIDDFQVQELRDVLQGTRGSALELRFSPSTAQQLNNYLIPPL